MMHLIIKKGVFMDVLVFLCNNLLYGVKTQGDFWRYFSGKKVSYEAGNTVNVDSKIFFTSLSFIWE